MEESSSPTSGDLSPRDFADMALVHSQNGSTNYSWDLFLGKSLRKIEKISKESYYKKYSIDHPNI